MATHGTHTTGIQQQTPQPKHSETKSLEVTERNNSPWHFLYAQRLKRLCKIFNMWVTFDY